MRQFLKKKQLVVDKKQSWFGRIKDKNRLKSSLSEERMNTMDFSSKLQKLRKRQGWSQEELAEKCGVSRQAISKWEAGQTMPELDKLLVIGKLFDVSMDYLMKEEVSQYKPENRNDTYSFEKICNLLLPRRQPMEKLYDDAELYDMINSKEREEYCKKYWSSILEGISVKTIHDCSIGTGQMTLALGLLGYEISGSDISKDMLSQCEINAKKKSLDMKLTLCDFRNLSSFVKGKYNLVISTGNSLPHVDNEELKKTLKEMDKLVAPGGYLYVDIRNWDKILREHQRFYFYNPWHVNGERMNLMQVWDYNLDGTITFNMIYTFEKEEKLFRKEIKSAYYYPVSRSFVADAITFMGYEIVKEAPMPIMDIELDDCDWYFILAKKY